MHRTPLTMGPSSAALEIGHKSGSAGNGAVESARKIGRHLDGEMLSDLKSTNILAGQHLSMAVVRTVGRMDRVDGR